MPVQIQVKGPENSIDYVLLGFDARIERIKDEKEVLLVTDVDNKPLYIIPLSQVRFIQPVPQPDKPVPRSAGNNTRLRVHIVGDVEGDFQQVCDSIFYPKPFNTLMADLFVVTGRDEKTNQPNLSRILSLPFDNIRFIDFNFIDNTVTNDNTEETGEKKTTPTSSVKSTGKIAVKPTSNGENTTNKPKFKVKPRD